MWDRRVKSARFYNCGDHGISIVATINFIDAQIYDWSAYIGVGSVQSERECMEYVAEHGVKLSRADALYYFPQFPAEKWRA